MLRVPLLDGVDVRLTVPLLDGVDVRLPVPLLDGVDVRLPVPLIDCEAVLDTLGEEVPLLLLDKVGVLFWLAEPDKLGEDDILGDMVRLPEDVMDEESVPVILDVEVEATLCNCEIVALADGDGDDDGVLEKLGI